MAQLYRKAALDRISSPEQLEKALKVTSPMSWLALIGISIVVVAAIVWSFMGTVSDTVTAKGMISAPVGINTVYASGAGKVTAVMVHPGASVRMNDPVVQYEAGGSGAGSVVSDQIGTVSEVLVENGDVISQGTPLARISPSVAGPQVVVCYLPLSQAKKIERGMLAQIYVDSVDRQRSGHLVARVVNVDAFATPAAGIQQVVGAENSLSSLLQRDGPVAAVTCELYPGETESGYFWTNKKGNDEIVSNGSLITAKIVTEEAAPISKLFSKWKDHWGD